MDGEDLPSTLLLAAYCCGSHVVCSLLPRAEQPVSHQPLPRATKVRPVVDGAGGGSIVDLLDSVACGEDRDSVITKRQSNRIE